MQYLEINLLVVGQLAQSESQNAISKVAELLAIRIPWLGATTTTTTTTTSPNVIPLSRGLGRSKCRQPYPCKYHYSQEADFERPTKFLRKSFLYFKNF